MYARFDKNESEVYAHTSANLWISCTHGLLAHGKRLISQRLPVRFPSGTFGLVFFFENIHGENHATTQ